MSLELIGFITLIAGGLCLMLGPRFSTFTLLLATLLGAAAATVLTGAGGASLPPANVLLFFLALDLMLRPQLRSAALSEFIGFRPGFWLLLTVVYGVLSAFVMPRIFAGDTTVFIVGHSDSGGNSFVELPLGPVSGNTTQSIYLCGDLVCFAVFAAYGYRKTGLRDLALAALTCAFVNIAFAGIDLVTFWTGTADALSIIRNAGYRMLNDAEIAGVKRIVGSFTEASVFAYMTLGLLAFTTTLWLRGLYERASGIAAVLSFICILFTTSTTGYAGLTVLALVQQTIGIVRIASNRASRNDFVFVALLPGVAAAITLLLWASTPTRAIVERVFELTVAEKLQSQSGVERSSWNQKAILALIDTKGLGAGVGSVRASSWLVAVPSNIGFFGSLTFGSFVVLILFGGRVRVPPRPGGRGSAWHSASQEQDALHRYEAEAIRSACRASCVAFIVGASIAGSFVDLGLPFFIFAGTASRRPFLRKAPRARIETLADAGIGRLAGA